MLGHLRHLANFAHIVEAGSITGAANKLSCSPSALSESVKILEAYFQEPLLERHKRGVAPTSKGSAIFDECKSIVIALERVMDVESDRLSGTVKVSVPSELLIDRYDVPIRQIGQLAPEINLVLAAENEILDHTKYARDIYVRVGRAKHYSGLNTLHLFNERAVLVGSSEAFGDIDPRDPSQVVELPYLGPIQTKQEGSLRVADPDETLIFRNTTQIGSIDARIALMRNSVGVTCCLRQTVADEIQSGSLVHLLPDRFNLEVFCVIASPHKRASTAVRFVADALAATHSGRPD